MKLEQRIFSGLLKAPAEARDRRATFLGTFPDGSLFQNEWYVFYQLVKLHTGLLFTRDFVKLFLTTQKTILMNNRNIDIASYAMGDTDAYITFMDSVLSELKTCTEYDIAEDEYALSVEEFRMHYVVETGITLMEQGATILTDGLVVSQNKTLAGFSDMSTHVINGISKLNNILNKTNRRGITVYDADTDTSEESKVQLVCKYGIEPLDKVLKGIYETDMVSVLAPPKGGKSRFCAFLVHNAIVQGTNVVTWSIENGDKGIEALIRACHFDWLYNRTESDVTKRKIIDADAIRKNALPDDLAELEAASWLDLRTNPSYGKWANIDETFDADTFLTILENAVDTVGAKLILVDYLQLVTGDGKTAKNERIGTCYQKSLQFLHSKKIAGLFPAQFKQAFVGDLGKKSATELASAELRDGGAETSEVIRTPSVLMALYGDVQSIRDGELKLLSIPSRNSAPFAPIDLYADFAVCNFVAIDKA